jgi:hypothetical protein
MKRTQALKVHRQNYHAPRRGLHHQNYLCLQMGSLNQQGPRREIMSPSGNHHLERTTQRNKTEEISSDAKLTANETTQ